MWVGDLPDKGRGHWDSPPRPRLSVPVCARERERLSYATTLFLDDNGPWKHHLGDGRR